MVNIKDEIKQKKFESVYHEALINFLFTSSWYDRNLKSLLKEHKISNQQYNVLRILRGAFPNKVSVSYISERMIDRDSNVTRLVDKLLERKFVTREACPDNRRMMDIAITAFGLDELKKIDPVVNKAMECFKNLNEDEAKTLNELLHKIRE